MYRVTDIDQSIFKYLKVCEILFEILWKQFERQQFKHFICLHLEILNHLEFLLEYLLILKVFDSKAGIDSTKFVNFFSQDLELPSSIGIKWCGLLVTFDVNLGFAQKEAD